MINLFLLVLMTLGPTCARRCYSCTGRHCSYKISSKFPSVQCPPEYNLCQSLCYNWTINVHRCTNSEQDCTSMRDKVLSTTLDDSKELDATQELRNYEVQNDEGEVYTVEPGVRVRIKVTDCFLCKDDLCNFNYLCDNFKNAFDYEEVTVPIVTSYKLGKVKKVHRAGYSNAHRAAKGKGAQIKRAILTVLVYLAFVVWMIKWLI